MWECDGCGFTGTETEVEAHITETNKPYMDAKDYGKIQCWGMMEVGGIAWENYHGKGIHPMTAVVAMVSDAYFKALEEVEGIGEATG